MLHGQSPAVRAVKIIRLLLHHMNVIEALKVVSKQRPCDHLDLEEAGFYYYKCGSCLLTFEKSRLETHQKSAEDFDKAIEVLRQSCWVTE